MLSIMNTEFMFFLNNSGDACFGFYRPVALFPASHQKQNKLWLPYEFIMDMSRVFILVERRNFQNHYAQCIADQFQLGVNRDDLSHLPLVDIWRPYKGQQVVKSYRWDQCFPLELEACELTQQLQKKRLPFITHHDLIEWYFDYRVLVRFFSDPRFQGFLHHSGFQAPTEQIQFDLSA